MKLWIEKGFCLLQYLLPKHLLSRLVAYLANTRITWIKNPLIRVFIDAFNVDMSEAKDERPEDYPDFNTFFTRPLKEGLRPIESSPKGIVSPCDGAISELGVIDHGSVMQAKGQYYSLMSLVAGDAEWCNRYLGGHFMTIYLSPKDYHRLHMPLDGKLLRTAYVPGELFSVNQATANHIPGLFARNERLICEFETPAGPMIMILVGAMIVAAIETVWAGQIAPPPKTVQHQNFIEQLTVELAQGEEMGRFKLGSTAILLFPEGVAQWGDELEAGTPLRLGQAIGAIR